MSDQPPAPSGGTAGGLANPWAETPEAVLEALVTSPEQGLSGREAQRRLGQYGPNQLRQMQPRSNWRILWAQFASLIVALLVVAAVIALAFEEYVEGFAIVGVIFINAMIGFVTERGALRSMEALRELGHSEALVRRDGKVIPLPANLLVPGDIVVLDAGDVLTADIRLIAGSRLQVDESPLTGESLPVDKVIDSVPASTAMAERTCILFKGTAMTRGAGEGVVVATGMATELGQISSLVDTAEPETTPLEKRLNVLGRRLVGLTIGITTVVAAVMVASGRDIYFAAEIGIALAVATIPEGLPVVATIALARGMWRMARRNALVQQLAAVETLGSTTVIFTDKTGTLTENRMTVVELQLADHRIEVEGTGLETSGEFRSDGASLDVADDPQLIEALRVAVLCNNATLEATTDDEVRATGDPTEVALLVAGAKAGLDRNELDRDWPEVHAIAFDPDSKRMATLHEHEGAIVAAVKGAPEAVIDCCASIRTRDGSAPLSSNERARWLQHADEMAASGQRILALATAETESAASFGFEDLTLIGLVGFFDPPRESVRAAIDACKEAGIRVVMVTGDHAATARTVASAVGLVDAVPDGEPPPECIDARNLAPIPSLTDEQINALLESTMIARATPRQKLELITLHQQHGAIVAMTGDGVNDAPALKKADIGVAMGLRGTQVAREAADMVLLDDELGTIVVAVAQGRMVFANIRKFVVYLLSCNVSEILAVGLGVLAQGPLPLLPLQILFLNLVTDVFPALALGVGEASPVLMRDPPRDPKEPVLTRRHWQMIFALGGIMAVSVLGALLIAVFALGMQGSRATTVAFLTLAMAQLWHVFSMRNPGSGWIDNEITRNPWVWGALGLCLGLLLAAVYWPPLAEVLSVVDPGPAGWGVAITLSLVPLVAGQLVLLPKVIAILYPDYHLPAMATRDQQR